MPSPKPTSLEDVQHAKKLGSDLFVHSAKQLCSYKLGLELSPNYVEAGLAGDPDVGTYISVTLDLTYFWIRSDEEKAAIKGQKEKLIQYAETYGAKPGKYKNWAYDYLAEFEEKWKVKDDK